MRNIKLHGKQANREVHNPLYVYKHVHSTEMPLPVQRNAVDSACKSLHRIMHGAFTTSTNQAMLVELLTQLLHKADASHAAEIADFSCEPARRPLPAPHAQQLLTA